MVRRDENWVPLCEREKVSVFWLSCICINQLSASLIWTPIGLLTNPLTQKLGWSNIAFALVSTIGGWVGIVVPPLIAAISDGTSFRWGRRRIYMVIGGIITVIGFIVLVISGDQKLSNELSKASIAALFLIGQILCSVGGNIFNGPGRSMASDLAPSSQQVMVSNICNVYTAAAGVISNVVTVARIFEKVHMSLEHFSLTISCVVGFICICISIFSSPEEPLKEKKEFVNPIKLNIAAFKNFNKLQKWIIVAAFFFQFGVNQLNTQAANFFGRKIFGGEPRPNGVDSNDPGIDNVYKKYDDGTAHASLLSLIQTILQFIFGIILTPIVNLLGFKWTWTIGLTAGLLCDICFFFTTNKWFYLLPYFLQSVDQIIGNSISFAMMSIISEPELLASSLSLIIFFQNISGGILNHFIFTMGFGFLKYFKENSNHLIGITFPFCIVSALVGLLFFPNRIAKEDNIPTLDDENENKNNDKI